MSEYDVLINKYNALNAGYDQLYPKPMKHANTHANGGTDPITPSDIGAYSKSESDTLLQNNDPRNWALGTTATSPKNEINRLSVVDETVSNGWYLVYLSDGGNIGGATQGTLSVDASTRGITQEFRFYYAGYGGFCKLTRIKSYQGEWQPWEWDNPPMMLGGIDADGNPINEYRTTERYMGHPVYVKLINFGSLPNADTKTAKALIVGTDVLVSIYGMATGSDGNKNIFPIVSDSGIVARFWFRANSGEITVRTTDDRSGFTAIFWVKYYKTTN